jgi:hypothetical protein
MSKIKQATTQLKKDESPQELCSKSRNSTIDKASRLKRQELEPSNLHAEVAESAMVQVLREATAVVS